MKEQVHPRSVLEGKILLVCGLTPTDLEFELLSEPILQRHTGLLLLT